MDAKRVTHLTSDELRCGSKAGLEGNITVMYSDQAEHLEFPLLHNS